MASLARIKQYAYAIGLKRDNTGFFTKVWMEQ
jgi:hypothetical protein